MAKISISYSLFQIGGIHQVREIRNGRPRVLALSTQKREMQNELRRLRRRAASKAA